MQSETALFFFSFNLWPQNNVEILLLFRDFMLIEHPFALRYYRGKTVSGRSDRAGFKSFSLLQRSIGGKNKPLVFIYIHLNHVQHNHLLVYFLGSFCFNFMHLSVRV